MSWNSKDEITTDHIQFYNFIAKQIYFKTVGCHIKHDDVLHVAF